MSWSLFNRDPRRLGPYEVLGRLGKGGAGFVFKALHPQSGVLVAIKVLCRAEALDPVAMKRFEQEFQATRLLQNPHIVPGLDFGYEGASPYLVMEYVEGESLGNYLKKVGRMAEVDAVRLAVQIAEALHCAHEQGLIHRDVNPNNIMLAGNGTARLTDFGLVKATESQQNLTMTATSLGTPCYMAPEQLADAKRIDGRCDVYALAATLYKAITGESPYSAAALGITIRKKLEGDIEPPRNLVPNVSPRVDLTIMRALSVSPAMRPESCAAFVRDLTGKELTLSEAQAPCADPAFIIQPSADRRGAVRRACRLTSQCSPVFVRSGQAWNAEIQDISVQGLGLALARRFERGTVLKLALANEAIGSLMARVVRTQAQEPGVWLLGCQFTRNLDDADICALLAKK